MNYIDFVAGDKEYKLRLNTRNTILLEKQLQCHPVAIFGNGDSEVIPSVTTMVVILHCALQQYHHGITLNNAYDIYDEWLADGHASTDFLAIILDIYKASGIIPKDEEEAKNV